MFLKYEKPMDMSKQKGIPLSFMDPLPEGFPDAVMVRTAASSPSLMKRTLLYFNSKWL